MKHPRASLKFVSVKDLDRSKMSFEHYTAEDPEGAKLGKPEGFIIDVDTALPYYVVVNAGGWFHSKHVLIPIGHFALDSESKRLVADVPKERMKRFPGFDLDLFPTLSQNDLDRMAQEIAAICCPDLVIEPAQITSVEVWAHYRTPTWWDPGFYEGRQRADKRTQTTTESRR